MSKYKARNKEFAGSVSPLDYKHMPNSSEVLMTRPQAQKLIEVLEKALHDAQHSVPNRHLRWVANHSWYS